MHRNQPQHSTQNVSMDVISMVRLAIERKEKGISNEHYYVLVASLCEKDHVGKWFRVLSQCPSLLAPTHQELIRAVFAFDMSAHDIQTLETYAEFLINLNTYHGALYLSKTFDKLIKCFIPTSYQLPGSHLRVSVSSEDLYKCCHAILKRILFVAPSSAVQLLWPIILESYPLPSLGLIIQKTFLQNILSIMDYCPILKERIFLLVVDKMIQIEVEMKGDEDPDDPDTQRMRDTFQVQQQEQVMLMMQQQANKQQQHKNNTQIAPNQNGLNRANNHVNSNMYIRDDNDESSTTELLFDVELQQQQQQERQYELEEMEQILDMMMYEVLNSLNNILISASQKQQLLFQQQQQQPQQTQTAMTQLDDDEMFSILVKAFDRIILNTHKPQHVQFLMFFYCRAKVPYAEGFLTLLTNCMANEQASPHLRALCAAYIGSFVGRASYISAFLVQRVLESLIPYLHNYLENNQNALPDVERHLLFYAVTQAVCYIIVFNHDRITEAADSNYIRKLGLERIIHSNLNPMKVCFGPLVNEFVSICKSYGVKCANILQRNSKVILPSKTSTGQPNRLDNYFPFDPHFFPLYGPCFVGIYKTWQVNNRFDGYESDGEMELDDRSTRNIDDDDEDQSNSMMKMMDFGKGSLSGHGELANSMGGRGGSFEGTSGGRIRFGSFDTKYGSQFLIEDQDDGNNNNSFGGSSASPSSLKSPRAYWGR